MKYWSTGLLLAFSFTALADDVIIYRWVDDNNVAHFSQNQPATGEYTEIVMNNANLANVNKKSSTPQPELPKKNDTKKDGISKNLTANIDTSEQCEEAKKNLATLTDFARIRFVDANGETQILNEAEQKEQIVINEKNVEVYCK